MLEISARQELDQYLSNWRAQGQTVALVPTMGNLHSGHLSLVKQAQQQADIVITSVYVNPTQFGAGEDFSEYPRTMTQDRQQLQQAGCDVMFTPATETLYPFGSGNYTAVLPPTGLTDTLCGASRPGHFDGVLSVVLRLFNLVQPHIAVFGEKDYQQLLIIQRMVTDLFLPVQIIPGSIVREASGLALSSRNQYLNTAEQKQAALLQTCLQDTAAALQQGRRDYAQLETEAIQQLQRAGFKPDYVAIRDAHDLSAPAAGLPIENIRVLAAAWLRKTRLIDNMAAAKH